jgi:hypothetical protein
VNVWKETSERSSCQWRQGEEHRQFSSCDKVITGGAVPPTVASDPRLRGSGPIFGRFAFRPRTTCPRPRIPSWHSLSCPSKYPPLAEFDRRKPTVVSRVAQRRETGDAVQDG